ncbi:DEAD/DEAH box helicase [Corynebacterium sp. 13CS0277]|uniref:DEAD/DEAH box helicase n=1 Tax=Corynebacterium sp. 13CS0277 TaxID=2071994 RepID=UPI000D040A4C|nr:DEAD/DEAH box helicase [Corynebacterium sp. 13CS0277]PRQ12055.1 DEAD/DEAH box helicase [Corynebacterium sp. 13CS0277]
MTEQHSHPRDPDTAAPLAAPPADAVPAAAQSVVDAFAATLPYRLDGFQERACGLVAQGLGVLVCAPTGAGKTVVGEFAVHRAVEEGTKCFYTTPIKALSNQKYHDLCATYGEDRVGLLTGDVSVNGDADVVVMTTEVLRNMIYAGSPALGRLRYVVMDEIHFLADKDRGAVWEEVILNVADDVAVIGLSATVSNSEEFGQWLSTVRGHTEVVVTDHRPIPLEQWMVVGRRLYPLFAQRTAEEPLRRAGEGGRPLTAPLSIDEMAQQARAQHTAAAAAQASAGDTPQDQARSLDPALVSAVARAERTLENSPRAAGPRGRGAGALSRPDMLEMLQQEKMLPVIDFIFSRAGCDKAVSQCARSRLTLTTGAEAEEIARIVDAGVATIPEEDLKILGFRQWRSTLMRGFAAHHAGMLPAFRHIVEELFVKGLLKAVFATETLALGINMPARTVFIERLVKFNGDGFADLTPGQYTQLTGRAGRRGIDTIGNAVVAWEPGVEPDTVAALASTRMYPLVSTFVPGYNMTINLLATMGYAQGRSVIERSFAQFQLDRDVVADARREDALARKIAAERAVLDEELRGYDLSWARDEDTAVASILEYVELRAELSAREKDDKRGAVAERRKEIDAVLRRARLGDIVALPGKKSPILACVVEQSFGGQPAVTIVTEQGWMGRVHADELALPPITLGTMYVPSKGRGRGSRFSAGAVAQALRKEIHQQRIERPKRLKNTVRVRPSKKATALKEQLRAHPAHHWPPVDRIARRAQNLGALQRKLRDVQEQMDSSQNSLGRTFDKIIDLLRHLGYLAPAGSPTAVGAGARGEFVDAAAPEDANLAELVPTEEGMRLARIHNSHDLLIAELLRRGIFDDLDPAELAAAVSQCTYEARKEGGHTSLEAQAATEALAEAFRRTLSVWEELVWEENHRGLAPTGRPDAGFALAIHQWTAGAPLGYCLAAANQQGAQLTPGDFVRQCRQVVDALDQVADTGYSDHVVRAARQAREAIRRGVVALGT